MDDLQTRADLESLLSEFYDTLLEDEAMRAIFLEVAKIDLARHLPLIADFWEQTLFHRGGYRNNVLAIHLELFSRTAIGENHFRVWLECFEKTVSRRFSGENASRIVDRAHNIASLMQIKMQQLR